MHQAGLQELGILKRQFPDIPILALTAAASEIVQIDVRKVLGIVLCEEFCSSVNRPSLFYEVCHPGLYLWTSIITSGYAVWYLPFY